MFPLLGPKDDIVDVQGVGQDGLHQRFIVVLHLPGQGRDDTGATLAPAVDDHPIAPGTVAGHGHGFVETGPLEPIAFGKYVNFTGLAHVQLVLEFGNRLPSNRPSPVSIAAYGAPDPDDVGIDPGQLV